MENVEKERLFLLNGIKNYGPGDIFYWMYREQRLDDNWGLFFALELARKYKKGLQIIFILDPFLEDSPLLASEFMLNGLNLVKERAEKLKISFSCFVSSSPDRDLLKLLDHGKAGALVCDFNPLRHYTHYCQNISKDLSIPFWEVDGHNIIPCRFISKKQEYAAHTLRRKIETLLPEFLIEYPTLEDVLKEINWTGNTKILPYQDIESCSWFSPLNRENIHSDIAENKDLKSGYLEGMNRLYHFLKEDMDSYLLKRNDPAAHVLSGLSPYLHFGQISPQTAAFEAAKYLGYLSLKGGFLDEIIVRRELSDNFCLHNENYDNFFGFPPWAQRTLNLHQNDQREYLYELEELEKGKTHDELWNAAQYQMVKTGIMHGYMRMYWAKKILEWSIDAKTAMDRAVYLNDKYSLDGRDPNGYAGCSWAIGGLHDRPWGKRAVFGQIRYMNARGCERKFDTDKYIKEVMSHGRSN